LATRPLHDECTKTDLGVTSVTKNLSAC
jgi:hypothetical protein